MTTTHSAIINKARELGGNSADAYWDEFGTSPTADGEQNVGDWDSSAWSIHWHELKDQGATDADYEACLAAWRSGFWSNRIEPGFYANDNDTVYVTPAGRVWLVASDDDLPAVRELGGMIEGADPVGDMLTPDEAVGYLRQVEAEGGEALLETA